MHKPSCGVTGMQIEKAIKPLLPYIFVIIIAMIL